MPLANQIDQEVEIMLARARHFQSTSVHVFLSEKTSQVLYSFRENKSDLHIPYRLHNIRPAMTERSGKIDKVTSLLDQHLVQGNEDRIETTGSLLPTRSLQRKSTREALTWVRDFKEDGTRFFTQPLIRDSLLQLAEKHNLALPQIPGSDLNSWASEEAKVLPPLLLKARRSTIKASSNPSAAMDNEETQPWQVDSQEDCY